MGNHLSTRWHGHQRKRLVEKTPSISIADLKEAGLFSTFTPDQITERLGKENPEVPGWSKGVVISLELPALARPSLHLMLRMRRLYTGGLCWAIHCPGKIAVETENEAPCWRLVTKLYLNDKNQVLGCRHCLSLVHKTRQVHDKGLAKLAANPERMSRFLEALYKGFLPIHFGGSALSGENPVRIFAPEGLNIVTVRPKSIP